jgi:hypothetical protein
MRTVKEIEKEISDFEKKYQIISHCFFDWKQIDEEVINEWKRTIKKIGGFFYNDKSTDGSDTYGFFISKKQIPTKELNRRCKLENELIDAD